MLDVVQALSMGGLMFLRLLGLLSLLLVCSDYMQILSSLAPPYNIQANHLSRCPPCIHLLNGFFFLQSTRILLEKTTLMIFYLHSSASKLCGRVRKGPNMSKACVQIIVSSVVTLTFYRFDAGEFFLSMLLEVFFLSALEGTFHPLFFE